MIKLNSKVLLLFLAIVMAMSLVLSAGIASASHLSGACGDELNAVQAAIDDANFLTNSADRNKDNLEQKLDDARVKLTQDKPGDAIDKLDDISQKATAWQDAPKPKLKDASGINGAVDAASACIGGL